MFRKILVCLDGSRLAEQILPYVTEQALHFNSKIVLFQVIPPPVAVSPGVPGVSGGAVETEALLKKSRTAETRAEAYLESLTQKLQKKGLKVASVTWMGPAGESIITYADSNKIDLIAIATHGHGGFKRAMFGSVADFVLRNSTLPLLVIKPQEDGK
jgi:nucleotide-binding universal stress UspA family protein